MKNKFKIIVLLSVMLCTLFSVSAFAEGWIAEGSKWKYQESDGSFATNKFKVLKNGNDYSTFYFDENSYMCVGLKKIGNNYYSFNIDGSANSRNNVVINGKTYETGRQGVVKNIYDTVDVDAYNAEFVAQNTMTAEKVAESQAAAAIAEEVAQEKKKEAENLQKYGPITRIDKTKDVVGPGADIGK